MNVSTSGCVFVAIELLKTTAKIPVRASKQAAGFDLYACVDCPTYINPGSRCLIGTGISMAIPVGFEGQIRSRSGMALNHGISVLNSPGTIDSDYRGEVKVILQNSGEVKYIIADGDRIAQIVFVAMPYVVFTLSSESLGITDRGSGGFGSTGNKEEDLTKISD